MVLETGEPREVHHFSLLVGYGAGAINPYLALETVQDLHRKNLLETTDEKTAVKNYIKAIKKGVLKVMSKMGISTLQSYRGAQIFEAVGLNREVIDKYFCWTASRIEGIGLKEIAEETLIRHRTAFPPTDIPENLDLEVAALDAADDVFGQVGAGEHVGVGHARHGDVVVALAAAGAGVGRAHQAAGELVGEVAAEDSVLDEDGLLGGVALVVHVDGAAAVGHAAVIDDGDFTACDLLANEAGEGGGLLAVEVGFEAVADSLVQ